MKASLSCDDLFNLQDLQEFSPKSPYVPDLAPDDGRVSLRQELIMPQILAASPPKAAAPPATKPATNASDFTAYQLFVRDVLVRYPCGSGEFEEFQKMFRDYLRKKCTRFVALRRHYARARVYCFPRSIARARADARLFEFERVRPQLLESRAKKLFGKKDKDLLATFHGFFEASLHDYEAKGEEARPPGARETLRRLDAAPAGREPAHDHARQGRAGGRRARSRHEPGHLGRRRARPAPRGRGAASERRPRRRRGPFLA